jgi:hypothetical protein
MPLKNGVYFCVNHPTTPMVTETSLNAVTAVEVTEETVSFLPAKGVLVKVYACPECGYVEMYWQRELAKKFAAKEAAKKAAS